MNAMGRLVTDTRRGLQFSYNLANLPSKVEGLAQGANAGLTLNYRYFSARFYDPFSARWTTRDPLAGKYLPVSPYGYCAGDPVNLVDSLGTYIEILGRIDKNTMLVEQINKVTAQALFNYKSRKK